MGYVEIIKGGLVTTIADNRVTTTPARRCDKCNQDRNTVGGRYYQWGDSHDYDWYCAECIK
jgi:hypothetical protein